MHIADSVQTREIFSKYDIRVILLRDLSVTLRSHNVGLIFSSAKIYC